ncbi:MAG TPA: cobyrinate a,c-diamide synthase [Bacillota bacterium]|nr:cobyrinate a,c-diamide synthase [Bacillota bacterium]
MKKRPRILIAGTQSGVGKTTISAAVMSCLTKRGYKVQPYKAGPDYIDPGYHFAATGRTSRNLDCWMMSEDTVREVFLRASYDADISVIEGVMGLYDGVGSTALGSTAHVARVLEIPVLLVLDARSMARSAAAVVLGYIKMDPAIRIAGVILNKVGSFRHYEILRKAVEEVCNVPVLGYVRRQEAVELPERHLGLLPAAEKAELDEHIEAMTAAFEEGVNIEKIVELARSAENCREPEDKVFPDKKLLRRARIGVFRDRAFHFYYQDSIDLLEMMGGEIVECSPLNSTQLPADLQGIYAGGGFPEMFLNELSLNGPFRNDVKRAASDGMPVYAECGGLMYLSSFICDFEGREYPAAGVLPGRCKMGKRRAGLGYVTARSLCDSIICNRGDLLRGHEFHYSVFESDAELTYAYQLSRWGERNSKYEGAVLGNIHASYVHLHFAGCPDSAGKFIDSCEKFK